MFCGRLPEYEQRFGLRCRSSRPLRWFVVQQRELALLLLECYADRELPVPRPLPRLEHRSRGCVPVQRWQARRSFCPLSPRLKKT